MLKEQLLEEAKTIEASVELDSIFEAVELSEDVKANFSTVFEATVKKQAIQLAESHIAAIAEKADEKVQELVESKTQQIEENMVGKIDQFFSHLAKEWLAENQVAVDKGIKADLFESMFTGLKDLFVEHNVVIPAESVDVVAEMEDELNESKEELSRLFEKAVSLEGKISEMERSNAIREATANLTESQKEKVEGLVEGLEYSDAFSTKLNAIVEMVSASKAASTEEKPLTESEINTITNDADATGLNFKVEALTESEAKTETDPAMAAYIASAKRIH